MSEVTDCDTDTDEKVQIYQILIILYPKEHINISRLSCTLQKYNAAELAPPFSSVNKRPVFNR